MLEVEKTFEKQLYLSKEDINGLKLGKYRISKNFSLIADLDDFHNETYSDFSRFDLQAEFVIE